jgi:hypothetical protein
MMLVNVGALDVGTEWFTVWITTDPKGKVTWVEEIDEILPTHFTAEQIMAVAQEEMDRDYDRRARIVGVSSQSRGDWLWYEEGMTPRR